MHRRKFLDRSFKTALVLSAPPSILACSGQKDELSDVIGRMISDINNKVPELLEEHDVAGLSVALIHAGQRVWSKGFGTTSAGPRGRRVDADTVFECASVSKTVFAYAIMKLCEQGKMDLDKPLVSYGAVPGVDDVRASLITPRHILSHRSGYQNWRTPDEPLKLHFDPGNGFMYSGEGYFYLQSLVTQLIGKTDRNRCGNYEAGLEVCATDIGDYLEQHVLNPLGMTSSGYLTRESMKSNYALPHDLHGKVFSKPPQGANDLARYAAAGGLLTTANDYSTFLIQLFAPKEDDPYRLNAKSIETMFTPQVKLPADQSIDGASSWALGWAVQERAGGNVVLHSGGQPGYRSLTMISPAWRSGFVMLTNSDNGGYVVYDPSLGEILNRLLPAES